MNRKRSKYWRVPLLQFVVMEALTLGPGVGRDVMERIPARFGVDRTTTNAMLYNLHRDGLATKDVRGAYALNAAGRKAHAGIGELLGDILTWN